MEHLYQVSAEVMRMWCKNQGMDISQVPAPLETSLKMGTLSGELTVVGQHQMDRVSAELQAKGVKAKQADEKADLLTPPAARGRSSDGGSAAWAFPGRAFTLTLK